MAHQSLYRKYRPETFDDVVGQQHIVRTLRNALTNDQVAHAYLFSGPRGTGKTTTARLLAKALLCQFGPTDSPDGTCDACVEIAEGNHPDVIELDAASRTGVDNVREEIINRIQYSAARGGYKVYIIDEVHMLSQGAFNAMLKTLEEPPSHVVFIMCTTHPHKVPETIRSRCQQFDFRPISTDDLADRLGYIVGAEGITAEPQALSLIARHARGGMRDAITSLEMIVAFAGNEITLDDVEGSLGEVATTAIADLLRAVARRDTAECFRWVSTQVQTGADLPEVVRSLTGYVRDVLVMAILDNADEVVEGTDEDRAVLRDIAAQLAGPERVGRMLDLLGDLAAEMRWSTEPRMLLELALVRMTQPQGEYTLEALAERIERLERSGVAVPGPGVAPAPAAPATPSAPQAASAAPAAARAAAADPSPAPSATAPAVGTPSVAVSAGDLSDPGTLKRAWRSVLAQIRQESRPRYAIFSETQACLDPDGTLVIQFPQGEHFKMKMGSEPANDQLVGAAFVAVFGSDRPRRYEIGPHACAPKDGAPAAENEAQVAASSAAATYEEAPAYEPVPYEEPAAVEGPEPAMPAASEPVPSPEPTAAPEAEEFALSAPPTPAPAAPKSEAGTPAISAGLMDILAELNVTDIRHE